MGTARRLVQITVLSAALYAGVRLSLGLGGSVERYCPFGGLETAWSVLTSGTVSCATGEHNITLMLALVVSALLVRKGFCSWICPVGTLGEWLSRVGSWMRPGRRAPGMLTVPARLDRALRWARLPILLLILAATALTGELVFRAYDPYYIVFSLGGHDVRPFSFVLLAVLVAGAVAVPMAWCRWLCPLGAALWPASRAGVLRLARDHSACTSCGSCDAACPHSLRVSGVDEIRSGECTLCMECTSACPASGALRLKAAGRRTLSAWSVPAVLLALVVAGVAAGSAIAIPSFTREFGAHARQLESVTFTVDGIRCVDTARRAASQLDGVEGVARFTAYASRGRATISYDPSRTDAEALRRAIEGPMYEESTGEYIFNAYTVLDVDGQR